MKLLQTSYYLNIKKSFQAVFFRYKHINNSRMDGTKTAYFHLLEGSDKFKVCFHYINDQINVSRQFNFERQLTETVENFLLRVTKNLEKIVLSKLNKKRKKGQLEEGQNDAVTVELLSSEDSKVSITETCLDVFFSNKYKPDSLLLRMIGLDYTIAINYPWIDSMDLPSSIMAGFPVYPSCFEAKFTDKRLSAFTWKKSVSKFVDSSLTDKDVAKECKGMNDNQKWIVVGDGFLYTPAVSDIGFKLKLECIPKNSTLTGPLVEKESLNVVEAGPGPCPFEIRHLYTQHKTCKESFRIVSYNILADVYSSTDTAKNELFPYCPTYALSIDYRKQLFLKELLGYNSDLLCLQEVDTKVFECDLGPVLGEQGLIGVHAKKSTIREGVSTFYSSSKFKLLDVQEVVLSQELLEKPYCSHILECVDKNTQLKERISGLGTAALGVVLECLDKPEEVIVLGNTHLYFHPDSDHIRLLQGGIVMAFLTNVVENVKKKNPEKAVSLICCGDFNSVPECGIYKLMTTKNVPADFVDWKSKTEEEVKDLSLSQPFNMESACGTPPYTNYTVTFAACLDYIYYQTDRLQVDNVVELPSGDELREHRAIPSVVFPSDHVALVAELKWIL